METESQFTAGKLLEIRVHSSHRHGYFLSGQEDYAQMVLSGALNDKKPVSSLFQKDLCSVFIFHLEKKSQDVPLQTWMLEQEKGKVNIHFSTCLDSIKSVCKSGMRQAL